MHLRLLRTSLFALIENPSLVVLLLFELFLTFLITVPFLMAPQHPVLLALYAGVFLLINAFFKSGVASMSKNIVLDGSTSLREFLPGARRYWGRFFLLFIATAALLFLVGIPLLFETDYQLFFLGISLLVGIAITGLLLWVMQRIVFEDDSFVSAVAHSLTLSTKQWKKTTLVLLIVLVLFFLVSLLSQLLQLPYGAMLEAAAGTMTAGMMVLGVTIEVVMAICSSVVLALTLVYTFHVYHLMRQNARAPTQAHRKPAHPKQK